MDRKRFLGLATGAVILAGFTCYALSDRSNFKRSDIRPDKAGGSPLNPDEIEILYLASLAPSGHNTQPWFVKYIEPYHWIIGNDKSKWLPGVDPTQRETILSIGAFLQNLEYAAGNLGYDCDFKLLTATNQEENGVEAKLIKSIVRTYDIQKIKQRRTVRLNYLSDNLKKQDVRFLTNESPDFLHFLPKISKESGWISEQTIEANRLQSYRDPAQKELSEWIRFSSKDAEKYRDGLTAASMEIDGIPGWVLRRSAARNFYGKANVMKKGFREQNVDTVSKQVAQSAGWILITGKDNSVASLLETGKRMQRLFLKVREKNIAIHPMTQVLEEPATNQKFAQSLGMSNSVQFILRTGYLKNYPDPVSLRRPFGNFVRFSK
ncbi:nitroreductase [Dyadobacter frigoris]|uniref:Nitroreductase n=1 Tax=Dyadobacter frigoris TaxID=2576211 RepID=A0A4U6CTJ3_9BACT|nr:nitroreductase [Dyadobacter frigoris]